jgi:hypothetical protein
MKNLNKSSGYSVIVSLLIIWFLLVLSTGIFNLVLNEMKDNKAMWDYIKAYAWAESARELALLQIKEHWYAYYDKIDHNLNNRSIILANDSLNTSIFRPNNDVLISYDIWSKVNEYEWTLESLEYAIIPLFYINDDWEQNVLNIDLSIISWSANDLSWNIIGKNNWISWRWINTTWSKKTLTSNWFVYSEEDINSFLNISNSNYLVLLNSGNSWDISYNLKANNPNEYFSKPETSIISSAEVWKYKQNIITDLDNTEFLNILKYSIYSN